MTVFTNNSDTFIQNQITIDLHPILYIPCCNLSCVLQDVNTMIDYNISSYILKDLAIVSDGTLISGSSIQSYNHGVLLANIIIPINEYIIHISREAYEIYNKLQKQDNTIVTLNPVTLSFIQPIILSEANSFSREIMIPTKCIYLECYALYTELLNFTLGTPLSTTRGDISNVISNIRWLSVQIENSGTQYYLLLQILRQIERTLAYISSIDFLFMNVYYNIQQQYGIGGN